MCMGNLFKQKTLNKYKNVYGYLGNKGNEPNGEDREPFSSPPKQSLSYRLISSSHLHLCRYIWFLYKKLSGVAGDGSLS